MKMSEHYHDVGDLRFLKEMGKLAPTEFNAWLALDKIVGRDDGAIPRKYRELIALGVAFTTQCPYSIGADRPNIRHTRQECPHSRSRFAGHISLPGRLVLGRRAIRRHLLYRLA